MVDWSAVGKRSVEKGKRYERKVVKELSKILELNFRRTICSGGQYECGDIKRVDGPFGLIIECKDEAGMSLLRVMKGTSNLIKYIDKDIMVVFNDDGISFCVINMNHLSNFPAPYLLCSFNGVTYKIFNIKELHHGMFKSYIWRAKNGQENV